MKNNSLPTLQTILNNNNYHVVRLLEKYFKLSSDEIAVYGALTRKQLYLSLAQLKIGVIKKIDNDYMLTDISLELIKYLNVIEDIESKKLRNQVREIIKTDPKLPWWKYSIVTADAIIITIIFELFPYV